MADVDILTQFLKYLNKQDVTNVMKQFIQADEPNSANPKYPCLGITDHGPAFLGIKDVTDFFNQLLVVTFPDMKWTPLSGAPQLTAANTIGIQMTVTGQYQDEWFQSIAGKKDHSSAPLSQLPAKTRGSSLGARKNDHNGLPAFGVFTFDKNTFLIRQLQIYLDRYAIMETIEIGWVPQGSSNATLGLDTAGGARRGRSITITIGD
jgi:hypothetical protein